MRVQEIMSKEVKVCFPDDTLNRAAQLMWDYNCGSLPVIDASGNLKGMVTDRDICMGAYFKGIPLTEIKVDTVMAHDIFSCNVEDELEQALTQMALHKIHRLPVLSNKGEIIGILSVNDAALATTRKYGISPRQFADTVASICEHTLPQAAVAV